MLKIYDDSHNFLKLLDGGIRNLCVREELGLGYKVLTFEVPCLDEYLLLFQEERYIETADYSYIIKGLNLVNNNFFKVVAYPDIEELTGYAFTYYDVLDKNPKQAYEYSVANTNWTIDYRSSKNTILTLQTAFTNPIDMVRMIAEMRLQELWFDTKNKVIIVYDQMGKSYGAYISNELKLLQARKDSNTYNFATVLTPIGKDGLRITDINNGRDYLEDFTYSNKLIQDFFIDESCEVAEILKQEAEQELSKRARPQSSYELDLAEVGADIQVGDIITIVDRFKKIKTQQRVVAITRYPLEPERGSIEIDNLKSNLIAELVNMKKSVSKELKKIQIQQIT